MRKRSSCGEYIVVAAWTLATASYLILEREQDMIEFANTSFDMSIQAEACPTSPF